MTHVWTLARTFPLWMVMGMTRTPLFIAESHIAPVSVAGLLAQICARFQAELDANGIEVREPQQTDLSQFTPRDPKRPLEELSIDREAFRQWLEQQEGPLVGTGRREGLKEWLVDLMVSDPLIEPPGHDDTPLARYLAHILGHRVSIAPPCVFLPHSADQPMMRLPAWARAFDEQVQPVPEKTITKEEALAALERV